MIAHLNHVTTMFHGCTIHGAWSLWATLCRVTLFRLVISISSCIYIMSDLYDAVEAGDLERVQVLVEQGVDKKKTGQYDQTPLHAASHNGHLAVVRYFVEQGADIEKADRCGYTPLIVASIWGHLEVVRYLLEQGANRDKASNEGATPLHLAALNGHLEIAKLLMVYGADLNARTNSGELPIDRAANEEMKQAIRDEPRRRLDEAPGKRCIEQDRHPNAAASASAQQEEGEVKEEGNKQPAEGETQEGEVADEDQDSEPSSDEDGK